ncbi:T9SS type A sorting domain-containing protein [Flavobacterium aquatile]|uniref:T9SS type A sorting domain-containing protein n=1 Tax=Flavobacterium aquatile TaxID=245 RepID=UPI00068AEEC3|nr:T9SS type A sorting domain-containing protein [Flavobacterium aquatile]OXA66216.1 T9SS C-terminal target domain-containing protein [Flavobacterium aquatile LMG 4008 = ATCC 11947]GEC77710.1 hypothetical protein FAQ01_05800 [Flavobacterium aquatile]
MKKTNLRPLVLAVILSTITSYSQDILWEKSFGGKHADYLMDAKATADYGFILAGSSLSKKSGNKTEGNNGDLDYWIWKMDEKGDLDWQKNFGGTGSDFLQSIDLTNDGGFIIAGASNSKKSFDKKEDCIGQNDFWIIKLNAKGSEEWQKTIGGYGQEKLHSIEQTRDGGYILGGTSSSDKSGDKTEESFGNEDCWIVKLDAKGKIEWQKSYGGKYVDELRSIEQTIDGGYIVGAYSNSPFSGNKEDENKGIGDYWVLKLDKDGTVEWQKTIGGNKDDHLYVAHQTYDKGYIIGGNSNSSSSNEKSKSNREGTDIWVLKLDEKGEIVWQETYDFGKVDVITSLLENDDHSFLIGSYAKGNIAFRTDKSKKIHEGIDDYIALKINEKGEELWSRIIGSNGEDVLKKVIETRDGSYLMAGTSNPYPVTLNVNNGSGLDNLSQYTEQNKNVQKATNEVNNEISKVSNDVNKEISDTTNNLIQKGKDAIGMNEDSRFKLGAADNNNGINLPSLGDDNNSSGSGGNSKPFKKQPASRDKKDNLGSNDFWVVKLKDENKLKEKKEAIEAFPNPTAQYTNVIVGYEFEKGTATVVDLAGRVLQTFEVNSRTIPIDLGDYPAGIYIVNIKTKKQSDGVKIIKRISKN